MALTLSRKKEQAIWIGDSVCIRVVEIRGGSSVRLSISAPQDIDIRREELLQKIIKGVGGESSGERKSTGVE